MTAAPPTANMAIATASAERQPTVIRGVPHPQQMSSVDATTNKKAPANGRGCNQEEIYDSW
jgi:hypothetical protein